MTSPQIITTNGPVVGTRQGDVDVFLGIPYAAGPVGERRFLPPSPPDAWTEPREATSFGPTAPQEENASPGGLPEVPEPVIHGDDFLNLNVWTTATGGDERRPVLVWIHGGGFFAGNSANPWYDGASFARRGLVVVSVNYRLGAEGFLSVPGVESNLALRDWIAALEWVRDNVAAFGGDPEQVTVMGQSAGGMAVAALLSSPASRGLFSRAIIASGVSYSGMITASGAAAVSRTVLERAGADADLAAARGVSPAAFVAAHAELSAELNRVDAPLTLLWLPVIDGELVPMSLLDAVEAGVGGDIPVLVGSTENEFAWRTLGDQPDSTQADHERKRREGQRLFADDLFRRPLDDFARARARAATAPTYRYEFQWRSQAAPYIGAGHSLDIPFFFNNIDAPYFTEYAGPNPPPQLAEAMHSAFASFALDGDPGWAAYDESEEAVMIFDAESRVSRGVEFEAD
jgi:para-nitrobenzyl esterase